MEINTDLLRVAKESLGYSLQRTENYDYSKTGLPHNEAYRLRREQIDRLHEAKDHLTELINYYKPKKPKVKANPDRSLGVAVYKDVKTLKTKKL